MPPKLKNNYYVMRHGQSKANVAEIIVSHPEHGTHEDYALSELGRKQAKKSAENCDLSDKTIIYTSDFSRARETAEIMREVLAAPEIHTSENLRERHFGEWEKTESSNYANLWEHDKTSADYRENSVESVNSVLERATRLVLNLEKRYKDKDILLVSHGDTLQILQTGFEKVDPGGHRSLRPLETAEIRQVYNVGDNAKT